VCTRMVVLGIFSAGRGIAHGSLRSRQTTELPRAAKLEFATWDHFIAVM
jgi:hypothetical protein